MKPVYITDYLFTHSKSQQKKPFIVFEGTEYPFQAVADLVELHSGYVKSQLKNVPQQKIVGILLPNGIDFIVAYLAIIHAGHIAMPLDPNFKSLEVQTVLDQLKPEFTITDATKQKFFRETDVTFSVDSLKTHEVESHESLRFAPEEQIASMLFTSGTTGNPKAVPYTHANHMWNPAVVSKLWKWQPEDTILLSLPLSHWHGLVMGIDGALYHGNTIYLQERFDAAATVEMLQSGLITLFMHVPIAYSKLVEYANGNKIDISQLRLCISGSSYLPPSIWQNFKELYGQEILERYGANEMGLLTSNTLDARSSGCVGSPLPDVTIKFQESGEIAMSSPGLFPGYWNNPEASNAQRTSDGLWLSGDIGEFDEVGRLHLKGRVQEKMKKFGYTVYPRDVEWALAKHPKVDEVAVLSQQIPDSLSDEFVYFVVGKATDEEINSFAKTDMPSFWRPDRIIHLDEIPRTGRTSKPAIKELKALL